MSPVSSSLRVCKSDFVSVLTTTKKTSLIGPGHIVICVGAEEETRTPTGLRPPDPEPGASTSSATSALLC